MGLSQRLPGIAAAFCSSLRSSLQDPSHADAILSAYALTPTTPDNFALHRILGFGTDIAYRLPAQYWTKSPLVTSCWTYQFNVPNPWDGPFKDSSTHLLDAVMLFRNYYGPTNEEDANWIHAWEMAKTCLCFAYGTLESEDNWPKNRPGELMTSHVGLEQGDERRTVRGPVEPGSDRLERLATEMAEWKIDLDEVSRAWDTFLAGR